MRRRFKPRRKMRRRRAFKVKRRGAVGRIKIGYRW